MNLLRFIEKNFSNVNRLEKRFGSHANSIGGLNLPFHQPLGKKAERFCIFVIKAAQKLPCFFSAEDFGDGHIKSIQCNCKALHFRRSKRGRGQAQEAKAMYNQSFQRFTVIREGQDTLLSYPVSTLNYRINVRGIVQPYQA